MVKTRYHQYQVVGRHKPTEKDASPKLYRMKLFATDVVRARSKFWYFLSMLKKIKKANGQIISVNEIKEEDSTSVKNFGVWIRYLSRSGQQNMYKEYRDTTLNGAVDQMYEEMASRHRARTNVIQIIKTAVLTDEQVKRVNTRQFVADSYKFPLTNVVVRPPSKSLRTTFKAKRPNTCR